MKNFNNFFLILFINILFSSSVNAATFYVNAATGNNSYTSAQAMNIETPWLTVQNAIDNLAVVNGDNIVIAVGTYAGFTLTKRLNIIGAWKGGTPTVNTIFNTNVTLDATGGGSTDRMFLKNLRVAVTSGDAIVILKSFVTLENVFATSPGSTNGIGLRINSDGLQDISLESCNFNSSSYSGIYFETFAGVDGFTLRNSTVSNNGYFGILAFQRRIAPTEIKNVEISHCAFIDNNVLNRPQGHTIYFEKLKNSVFENITVVMPSGNNWIGIDINLLSRIDYTNIEIRNSRIIRPTPGSGIWIQARNDLPDPPARLDTVVIRGCVFTGCDTNLSFNRQIRNMTVDKCDLSNYTVYGLVNFTDQTGNINANNNRWKNGVTPDTTVISAGLITSGSPVIAFMPATDGIFLGMCIAGPGIPPGSTVIAKTLVSVTMSQNAISSGFISTGIGFNFGCVPSTDIVRTSANFVTTANPLPFAIVNQANVSFPNLASAIAGTSSGGTIWNVPAGMISGTTLIDRDLKLIGPGSGFLQAGSLTTFENLTLSGADLLMGSDFAVANNFTPNHVIIGTDNTLIINGAITPGGLIEGGNRSDMFFGGTSASTALTTVEGGLRSLQLSRPNGISLADSLFLYRLLFLQNGLLRLETNNLILERNATIFNPFPTSSYVATNDTGEMRKNFDASTPTAFNFTIGDDSSTAAYTPVRVFFRSTSFASGAYLAARVVPAKHPENGCPTDYLNRYWVLEQAGIANIIADTRFKYVNSDVVGSEDSLYGARWNGFIWESFTHVNTTLDIFDVNNITELGDFTSGARDCLGGFNTVINVKALLEGGYVGGGIMRTSMNAAGIIPLNQPYNTPQFNYNGTEHVSSIPVGVVDWVYLEIRTAATGTYVLNGRRAAFIKDNGMVVDLDGISPVKIPSVAPGNYFVVVGHRVHLPVMTNTAPLLDPTSVLYNFTDDLTKYYGGQAAALIGGLFGLFGGDANRSFIVSAADYAIVTNNLLMADYNDGDLNLTGIVSAADYPFITNNLLRASNVPHYPPPLY